MNLLKILSEVSVTFKYGPLASIWKTGYVIKTGPTEKFSKIRETLVKVVHI